MKPIWLAGTALLALAVLGPAAQAQCVTFTYKPPGSIVTWTVPATGLYQIAAYGAQGGNITLSNGITSTGGLGVEIGGNFTLNAGETLQIAVGGAGSNTSSAGAGGGGSFVVASADTPLIIAGGGGGAGSGGNGSRVDPLPGGNGLTGVNGGNGNSGVYNSGTNGHGGGTTVDVGCCGGGGGGGFLSAGADPYGGGSTGGAGFPDLTGGYKGGGFGGGGGADCAAGGGGGYSGGGGGSCSSGTTGQGGGGGSFNAGINKMQVAGLHTGDGEVVINTIFVGTPGKPNCHGEVVSSLAKQYGGLDAAAAALGYSSVQMLQNGIATYCAGAVG